MAEFREVITTTKGKEYRISEKREVKCPEETFTTFLKSILVVLSSYAQYPPHLKKEKTILKSNKINWTEEHASSLYGKLKPPDDTLRMSQLSYVFSV